MARVKDPPSKAARLYAATRAALADEGPSFGVRTVQRGQPSGLERTRAAYADPSMYPMPNPSNWLAQLSSVDPKTLPRAVQNWLGSAIVGAVEDPVSALMPFPKAGRLTKGARAVRLAGYENAKVAEAALAARTARMKGYAERMGAVDASLEQLRKATPVVRKVTKNQRAAENAVLQRARADVFGPEAYKDPLFEVKPRPQSVDIPMPRRNMLAEAAGGDNVGVRLTNAVVPEPWHIRVKQQVADLDARNAPDSEYRGLLSSASRELNTKGSKHKFKTWREKALQHAEWAAR